MDNSNSQGIGKLIFRVSTARGAIPLQNAEVRVSYHTDEAGDMRGQVIAVMLTDRDGKTPPLELPAPARSASMSPSTNGVLPFSLYDAEISLGGFYRQEYTRIPIFDGITSIQPASLIPLPENGQTDNLTPEDTNFTEGEAPDL
ncbi:MAG: hypothetical protein IJX74_05445 [Clostridia bacterium]|nr:hypothetical protein [Clostridia bacterium]